MLSMAGRCYNLNLLQLIFNSKSLGSQQPCVKCNLTFSLEGRKLRIITAGSLQLVHTSTFHSNNTTGLGHCRHWDPGNEASCFENWILWTFRFFLFLFHSIPRVATLTPHILTLIPRVPTLISLIPFPDSPFRLSQISNLHWWTFKRLTFFFILQIVIKESSDD